MSWFRYGSFKGFLNETLEVSRINLNPIYYCSKALDTVAYAIDKTADVPASAIEDMAKALEDMSNSLFGIDDLDK